MAVIRRLVGTIVQCLNTDFYVRVILPILLESVNVWSDLPRRVLADFERRQPL